MTATMLQTVAAEPEVHASIGTQSCQYAVAYTAPVACPDAGNLAQRLGTNYRVSRGNMQSCEDCVRGIVIEQTARGTYQMQLAGLETTSVERRECGELLDLAVYAIEASDLPKPECVESNLRVGISSTPFINLEHRDLMVAIALRGTALVGAWRVTPFASWFVPTEVESQVAGLVFDRLSVSGFGAGVDVCRSMYSSLQLCGAGAWRRLAVAPIVPGYSADSSRIWTFGGGLEWDAELTSALHFQLAPTLMAVVYSDDSWTEDVDAPLYSHSGYEVLVRVGFSWDFGGSDTPVDTERLRGAASVATASSTYESWL